MQFLTYRTDVHASLHAYVHELKTCMDKRISFVYMYMHMRAKGYMHKQGNKQASNINTPSKTQHTTADRLHDCVRIMGSKHLSQKLIR